MTDTTLWWITLGVGLVVAVIAVVLLQTFLSAVLRIEEGAKAIWEAGKQVARNTATTWQLEDTSRRLDELTREALRHDQLLRTGSSVPGEAGRP